MYLIGRPKEGDVVTQNPESRKPNVLETVENEIYFYGDVERENVLKLNQSLRRMGNDLTWAASVQKRKAADIYLYINSFGGSVFDGFSAADAIINSRVPVNTIVDGTCASAATFLSVVGSRRYIRRHSYMLIHQLSGITWGKYSELKDFIENAEKLMKMIKEVYKEYTKIPMKKLEEILKHDLWFDADECLTYGLVDEVWQG